MGNISSIPPPILTLDEQASVLGLNCSLHSIAEYVQSGRAKRIILMTGAGISVTAGIPDFRTPGTGLYANLQKYNLPTPECMFSIDFFRENPRPFYDLARELMPTNYSPTPTHCFIKLLQNKSLLHR